MRHGSTSTEPLVLYSRLFFSHCSHVLRRIEPVNPLDHCFCPHSHSLTHSLSFHLFSCTPVICVPTNTRTHFAFTSTSGGSRPSTSLKSKTCFRLSRCALDSVCATAPGFRFPFFACGITLRSCFAIFFCDLACPVSSC